MKKKLFSKFRDYNYILDKILEEKKFSEDATNLLLNMIYKIEVSYKDYAQIKGVFEKQNDFIDSVIKIVSDNCNQLLLVDPKQEEIKAMKEQNVLALTDEKNKKMYVYPTELAILYGLIDIKPKYFYVPRKYYFIKNELQNVLVQGTVLNYTEVIRNFNGWSWNIDEDANIDQISNMIYQAIRMLIDEDFLKMWEQDTSPKKDYIQELRNELTEYYGKENSTNFYIAMARLVLAKNIEKNADKIKIELVRSMSAYENMKDKTEYIYRVSEERKRLLAEIEQKDFLLNDDKALIAEFNRRNMDLPNENKILNVSVLAEMIQTERKECVKKMNGLNDFVKPTNYTRLKNELFEKIQIMSVVNDKKDLRDFAILFNKEIIKCFAENIEKISSKEEIIDIIYKMRYYKKMRVTKDEKVEDIPELNDEVTKILKYVITKGCKEKVFNIFCKDIEYNFRIIETALDTAIANYEYTDIAIEIKDDKLEIVVYDNEVVDKKDEIDFPLTKKDLDVRQKKRIPMYVI